jgi:3',5'-cyclic AMP phosphodiesterase CpdA
MPKQESIMRFVVGIVLLLITALVIESQGCTAHDGATDHRQQVTAVERAEMYKPTAMPDRIILTFSGDPKTTQSVNWRTSVEVRVGLAKITEAEAGPYFHDKARQVEAVSQTLETDLGTAHYHSATFKDLKPGTTYAYRLGDGPNWSEWFQFRTAAAKAEPFSFVYFGDAQNNLRSMWSRVVREAYREAPKAAFLLHAGDLVDQAESDSEWGEWFAAGAWLNAMTPSVAIPGNHEQAKLAFGGRRLSHHWRPSFTFPENGPAGLEESCYTFTYHNLRIIGLDSNTMQEEQAEWLDNVLSKNQSEWVVCTFHHPIFSTAKRRDNPHLRALWKPVLDKHTVDLVLQGHDHTYGRTGMEVPSALESGKAVVASSDRSVTDLKSKVGDVNVATGIQQVDSQTGTVYVVSVSGPKMYDNKRYDFMKRVAEDTQLYQVIHVDQGKLRFEARTAIGELYDAFELHKQEGMINKLVELEVEVPQYLRPAVEE